MLPHARRRSRLVDVPIECDVVALPARARRFLNEAERRILDFQQSAKIPGFVPSDFERVYAVLQTISEQSLAAGPRFCEWGSGFGVVAGFAAMLGFETFGIEIELELVEACAGIGRRLRIAGRIRARQLHSAWRRGAFRSADGLLLARRRVGRRTNRWNSTPMISM